MTTVTKGVHHRPAVVDHWDRVNGLQRGHYRALLSIRHVCYELVRVRVHVPCSFRGYRGKRGVIRKNGSRLLPSRTRPVPCLRRNSKSQGCVSFIHRFSILPPFEFSFFIPSLFLFFSELEPDRSRLRTSGELVRDSNRK